MHFVIDAQLPPALARRLKSLGHSAEHVADIGFASAADLDIWTHAATLGAVIVSKDQDFAERCLRDPAGAQVVWIRLGNTTNAELWKALEPRFAEIIEALGAGERLLEIV